MLPYPYRENLSILRLGSGFSFLIDFSSISNDNFAKKSRFQKNFFAFGE